MHPVANAVIGGWQVSSIVRFGSGLPLGFTAPNHLAITASRCSGRTSQISRSPRSKSDARPLVQYSRLYRAGHVRNRQHAPRWVPNIRFGATRHADVAILKNFRFFETWKAQFRAEMFNMTNTPQFGRANTTLGNADFGRVSGTTNIGPRNIQLGLRIQF